MVLIGTRTLDRDKPQLTVRHVPGENSLKIVLGNSKQDIRSCFPENEKILLVTNNSVPENNFTKVITLACENGLIDPVLTLKKLWRTAGYPFCFC